MRLRVPSKALRYQPSDAAVRTAAGAMGRRRRRQVGQHLPAPRETGVASGRLWILRDGGPQPLAVQHRS